MRIQLQREAFIREDEVQQPHPDLAAQYHLCGCVHTTGGRALLQPRTASQRFATGFDDPSGWSYHTSFAPSSLAIQGAKSYASLKGLPDPHAGGTDYLHAARTPASVQANAKAYDAMPDYDPNAVKSFQAMRNEVGHQFDHMTNRLGIQVNSVDHDPYPDVDAMMHDINHNKRLNVMSTAVTGAHPLFSNEDNDKFRAVHDFFGHAATGRSFDRHGEQAAYLAHAQMFSPQAQGALASETNGQNSSLIYNGTFGPQKIAVMPQHIMDRIHLGKSGTEC